jgi:hypothetical protein
MEMQMESVLLDLTAQIKKQGIDPAIGAMGDPTELTKKYLSPDKMGVIRTPDFYLFNLDDGQGGTGFLLFPRDGGG